MAKTYTYDDAHADIVKNFDKFRTQLIYLTQQVEQTGFVDEYAKAFGGRSDSYYISEIREDGIEISGEYNDACSCHPEYRTETFLIPWDVVALVFADYDEAMRTAKARGAGYLEEKAQAKAETQRKANEAIEAAKQERERKEYERLQQKYGS